MKQQIEKKNTQSCFILQIRKLYFFFDLSIWRKNCFLSFDICTIITWALILSRYYGSPSHDFSHSFKHEIQIEMTHNQGCSILLTYHVNVDIEMEKKMFPLWFFSEIYRLEIFADTILCLGAVICRQVRLYLSVYHSICNALPASWHNLHTSCRRIVNL